MRNKSILNVDFNIDNEIIRNSISDWIRQNVYVQDFQLSDNPDSDGMFIATSLYVAMNTYATSLTNKLFKWGEIQQYFDCSGSRITNLEGAPQQVHTFDCSDCVNLTSLKGAPETCIYFYCSNCYNLTSLEGGPKIIKGSFYCDHTKINNLIGSPKKCPRFYCSYNDYLTSLEGVPKNINRVLDCSNCQNLRSIKGAPKEVSIVDIRDSPIKDLNLLPKCQTLLHTEKQANDLKILNPSMLNLRKTIDISYDI